MQKDPRSEDELRIANLMGDAMRTLHKKKSPLALFGGGCGGCVMIYLLVGLFVGGAVVRYDLHTLFGLNPPFAASCIGGIFLWGIALPVGIIVWLCQMGGAHSPMFHMAMLLMARIGA